MGEKGRWRGGIRPYEAVCSAPTRSPIQVAGPAGGGGGGGGGHISARLFMNPAPPPSPSWNAICRFFLFRCRKRQGLSCIAACIRPFPQSCLYPLSQRSHLTPWAALIPSHTSCGLSTLHHIDPTLWPQNGLRMRRASS